MASNEFLELLDALEDAGPLLREESPVAESQRDLTERMIKALVDGGYMRIWVPRVYGGHEMHPAEAATIFAELARLDSAAAWAVANCAVGHYLCQTMPRAGSDELFAEPDMIMAGAFFPPGHAIPAENGYRVSGRWSFGSTCRHARWLGGQAFVMENGEPRIGEAGVPDEIAFVVDAKDGKILDTWHTLGMRGTGSFDFALEDTLVPERFTSLAGPLTYENTAFQGPLYRLRFWILPVAMAGVALGIAQAAIEDLVQLAGRKTPSYTQVALSDRPGVQDRLARATALVGAGRAYLQQALEHAYEEAASTSNLTPERGMPIQLASSFATEAACQAVDLVHACAGTSAIRDEQRFQRHFRDVHTISQHAFPSPAARFESVGKLLLGKESDWVFFYA